MTCTEFQKALGDKFFSWYNEVFKDSALSAKEKSIIALAVHMRFNVLIALMPIQQMQRRKDIQMNR